MTAVKNRVGALLDAYVVETERRLGRLPRVPYDEDWPSVCVERHEEAWTYWRPKARRRPLDFSPLGEVLEVTVHPDLCDFYAHRFAANLPVLHFDQPLELLQVWNDDDAENLFANLIGHALEKKRVRQPLSLFFAVVDDHRFLSVDNATGEVLLETLGERRPRPMATDLNAFLADARPQVDEC